MSEDRGMTQPTGAGVFSVADLKRRMAEREAARTAEETRHMRERKEKQKAVMAEFHKPPERTADQLMQLVMGLVNTAAERGQSEVQGLPLSECVVQRWRPKDQQLGARLARVAGGPAQVWLRILARPPEAARLWSEG
jgi:hypothetical protein